MKDFTTSDFFVSFTQQGVFLDKKLISRLKLGGNDPVQIRLLCRGKLVSTCYGIAKPKDDWDLKLEKQAYSKFWYYSDFIQNFLLKEECVILSYVEWNCLTLRLKKRNVILMKPSITISKLEDVEPAQKVKIKVIQAEALPEDLVSQEFPNVVNEKQEITIWGHTRRTKHSPINLRKVGLTSLPELGQKRRKILAKVGIKTILELISRPFKELCKIPGISRTLIERWIIATSKVLETKAFPLTAQVFLTEPREKKVVITDETRVDIAIPYYAQFFVRGHPLVESKILGNLDEYFGVHFNVIMPRENLVTLERKDKTQEIRIFGPWIVEMTGFENLDEIDDVLKNLGISIESAFDLWGEKEVVRLVEPQKAFIDADQILNRLVTEFSLRYSSIEDILWEMERDKKIIVDTNVLIDERLSSLILRAMQGTLTKEYSIGRPEIIVPNIVTFELKSMTNRYRAKETQFYLGNRELLRLKALHEAGYIVLKYIGDIPFFPPITQYEKGLWKFVSSLRDEFILKVLSEMPDSVLLTTDGRLARSAYIKGHKVVMVQRLVQEIKEKFEEDLKMYTTLPEQERGALLRVIAQEVFISKETASRVVNSIVEGYEKRSKKD